MRSIRIERYPAPADHSGLIEGVTDDERSWIIYLDAVGRPAVYWPEREPGTGAVIGEPVPLLAYQPVASVEEPDDTTGQHATPRPTGP